MSTNWHSSDSTLLHVMLGRLQCPYQVEDDQLLCSFYRREAFCPFGHRSGHTPVSVIPLYICVDHLVGKCTAELTQKSIDNDWLTRCSCGYHPTWIQLIDLEEFNRKVVALEQSQQDQVQVVYDHLKCTICLEQMNSPFGLLEHCCHLFCAECIVVWQETDHQKRCPVCRVHSRRVLLWSNTDPIRNEQAKLELFRLQARCIDLFNDDNREDVQVGEPLDLTRRQQLELQLQILRQQVFGGQMDLADELD